MQAIAWKETNDDPGVKYRIQINDIPPRSVKKVQHNMKDWSQAGSGYRTTNKTEVFLYVKTFDSVAAWRTWAKKFPYKLQEVDENGKAKKIKLGIESQHKNKKKKVA